MASPAQKARQALVRRPILARAGTESRWPGPPVINFDHNATTPMLPEARQTWLQATEQYVGNPSSPHRLGSRAEAALASARENLATRLRCDVADLVWTSGATESANTVLHHVARVSPVHAEIWTSAIEHPCVLAAARHHLPNRHRLIPVTPDGVVDLTWLEAELSRTRPALIAVMAANNETGILQPWRETLSLCREHDLPFFCDAAQWIGKLPPDGLGGCDFFCGSAHKFGGPRGVGFLKCPSERRVEPLLLGGPQEDGRRAGTENVAGVLSMVAALEARERELSKPAEGDRPRPPSMSCVSSWSRLAAIQLRLDWRRRFEQCLLEALPGSRIVGADQPRLWNTVSALMPTAQGQPRWVVKLDKLGFAVSTGSACSSGKAVASHVLAAMGYAPSDAGRVLRFSSGWETTAADWEALAEAVRSAYQGSPTSRCRQ
jgi:cysteine desulfurase